MPAFDASALPGGDGAGTEQTPHLYTARVPNSVEDLTVMAGAMSSGAMVSITSEQDTSVSGGAVDLIVDDAGNVIDITVTAEDRSTMKYYRVTVTRASSTASTDATLSALTVTPGMGTSPDSMTLGTKFEYSVDLANNEASASVAIVATATDGAVVTVKKGNMVIADLATVAIDDGDNTITVEVLPPSFVAAQKKTYTLTINRARRNASDDARLSSLSLRGATLMPAFNASALPGGDGAAEQTPHLYTARVPNSVEDLTVMAGAMSSGAMVSITSEQDTSVSGGAVDLIVDDAGNVIDITVTAEDRSTMKYYRVTVTRVAATASPNADLMDLVLNLPTVTLDPAFDTANLPALMNGAHHFSASVSRGSDDIRVVPTRADADGAIVIVTSSTTAGVIDLVNADERTAGYEVDLVVGDNVITVNGDGCGRDDDEDLQNHNQSRGHRQHRIVRSKPEWPHSE